MATMKKSFDEFSLSGYGDRKTKFVERLIEANKLEAFVDIIVQPIAAVLRSSDQTAVLTITGHADRVDIEGLTREQRRADEFTVSNERAIDAAEGTRNLISGVPDMPKPDELPFHQQLEFLTEAAGAAALIHANDVLTPEQRLENRRVVFRLFRFQPA
jgi:flagellar motor protein MotB